MLHILPLNSVIHYSVDGSFLAFLTRERAGHQSRVKASQTSPDSIVTDHLVFDGSPMDWKGYEWRRV